MISIVECPCNTLVYIGGDKHQCPQCGLMLHVDKEGAWIVSDEYPRLPVRIYHKCHSSDFTYFPEKYPEINTEIMYVWTDGQVEINLKWSKEVEDLTEIGYFNHDGKGLMKWKEMKNVTI
jgi:hypothetical protein